MMGQDFFYSHLANKKHIGKFVVVVLNLKTGDAV